jgi:dihydroneopterin aldolase
MILKIKNLRLKTILGIYQWEEDILREIIINVEIETDHDQALSSDDIKDAIDYDLITGEIKQIVINQKFKLIEKMVGQIMVMIMQDLRIKKCRLEIDKVGAVEDLESFSVTEIRVRK